MFLFNILKNKISVPSKQEALPGRAEEIETAQHHFVNGKPLKGPFPDHLETIILGLGCFWGAERIFWQLDGVYVTAVGYSAGHTENATYQEVCSGQTGHNEVVLVVFDPAIVSLKHILSTFFEAHDPTQGMRQGNDVGTQYRSGVYYSDDAQREVAEDVKASYEEALIKKGFGKITTEIRSATPFYYAEEYHQQYLAKNPSGYCGLGGTGVSCPTGLEASV
ncbi:MAG: peptide-methionine (S)-S-oxide reductase MsrA [Pseudomonadota bacterium]